ncbi:Ras GTPase-activating protein nGAP [Cichlidogyrus casuarinus]|uniref:Ras GTPase-activating protein nGAP n=1 Tax=Cichlidogyrus casuarinus TaxID=1844966 RepID=A0ABD2Q521_9PLAT
MSRQRKFSMPRSVGSSQLALRFMRRSVGMLPSEATFSGPNSFFPHWIGSVNMRRSARSEMESEKHWDFSLKVSIQEAKNLPNKRRNLPEIQRVTIKLCQASKHDDEGKRRRSNKSLNHCIGYVNLPVNELLASDEIQEWMQLRPANTEFETHLQEQAGRSRGSLRGNLNSFTRTSGLSSPCETQPSPTTHEPPASPTLLAEYRSLVEYLEPCMDVRGKEELASSLVNIWDRLSECQIQDLLLYFTSRELSSNSDISLIFRSNTVGSKALESYVKLVGSSVSHSWSKILLMKVIKLEYFISGI